MRIRQPQCHFHREPSNVWVQVGQNEQEQLQQHVMPRGRSSLERDYGSIIQSGHSKGKKNKTWQFRDRYSLKHNVRGQGGHGVSHTFVST